MRDRHADIGVAVRINCPPFEVELDLPNHAFDCHPDLALTENDRLMMNDRPAVSDICVHANGRGLSSRIDACVPEVA